MSSHGHTYCDHHDTLHTCFGIPTRQFNHLVMLFSDYSSSYNCLCSSSQNSFRISWSHSCQNHGTNIGNSEIHIAVAAALCYTKCPWMALSSKNPVIDTSLQTELFISHLRWTINSNGNPILESHPLALHFKFTKKDGCVCFITSRFLLNYSFLCKKYPLQTFTDVLKQVSCTNFI